ncbi:T9SS sorting signal type C domain-containing protein [Aquimarina rhabdastrellae]
MKSFFTLFLFYFPLLIFSQWHTDTSINTLVVSTETDDMKSILTSNGETIVVFWKSVAPPINYELRMQKLNIDGTQTLGPEGVLISNTIPMSTFTAIWSLSIDTSNHIYIGLTGTDDDSGYVYKVDTNGNNLWGASGISLGSGHIVTTKPLQSGDLAVTWISSNDKTKLQKYSPSGLPIWSTNVEVTSGTSNTAPANLSENSNGEITILFHTFNYGINSTLWAQKYSTTGTPTWANPTQLSDKTTAFNRSYSVTQDGDIIYLGYYASSNNRFDAYVQRLDPNGSLPWGINGMDVDINQTSFELDTRIAHASGSSYIWSITTYTDINQSMRGEYVQKFDKITGNRLFTDNAKEVFAIDNDQNVHVDQLLLVQDQPLFLHKSGMDNGATPVTLGLVYLTSYGDLSEDLSSIPLATYIAPKKRYQLNRFDNQVIITFIEDKGDGKKIYAQNFNDATLGIEDIINTKSNLIYLNPFNDTFNLESSTLLKSIVIYDTTGRPILRDNAINATRFSINTSFLSHGIYFAKVFSENNITESIKLLKVD